MFSSKPRHAIILHRIYIPNGRYFLKIKKLNHHKLSINQKVKFSALIHPNVHPNHPAITIIPPYKSSPRPSWRRWCSSRWGWWSWSCCHAGCCGSDSPLRRRARPRLCAPAGRSPGTAPVRCRTRGPRLTLPGEKERERENVKSLIVVEEV